MGGVINKLIKKFDLLMFYNFKNSFRLAPSGGRYFYGAWSDFSVVGNDTSFWRAF